MTRKDELLQELQRGGAGLRDSGSLGASSGIASGIEDTANTARGEARSARLAALAQETVRSLQAKTNPNPNPDPKPKPKPIPKPKPKPNPNPNPHPHPHPHPNPHPHPHPNPNPYPNPNHCRPRRAGRRRR